MLQDIQVTAKENYQSLKRIYNLEDFYENNLLPKLLSFPNQFINKIKQNQKAIEIENLDESE